MTTAIRIAPAARLACLACLLFGGCGGSKESRATVEFHAQGAREAIGRLRGEVNRPKTDQRQVGPDRRDNAQYRMQNATEQVSRALRGLPARIDKAAQTRKAERRSAAEKARQLFEAYRPALESLRYDKAQANARLDELIELLDQVEQP